MVLMIFRGARRLLNTIRIDLDTAGAGLTLPNNEITQYSCFWECQCSRNDPRNLPFCPGPPQNTFILFLRSFKTIVFKIVFFFKNHGFEISKTNNKGVLWRPWTKWKILRVISSTLTFPTT